MECDENFHDYKIVISTNPDDPLFGKTMYVDGVMVVHSSNPDMTDSQSATPMKPKGFFKNSKTIRRIEFVNQ